MATDWLLISLSMPPISMSHALNLHNHTHINSPASSIRDLVELLLPLGEPSSLPRALPNFVPIAENWLDMVLRAGERDFSSAIALSL